MRVPSNALLISMSIVSAGCRSAAVHGVAHGASASPRSTAPVDANRTCQMSVSQRSSNEGCWLTSEMPLGALNGGPLFWHVYTYPTSEAAAAARGPRGAAAESFGRHWTFTIEDASWRPIAGERVALIGPLSVRRLTPYTARYMEAVFSPDYRLPPVGHRHSGAEAWYVVTGAQCLETPTGPIVVRAGEGSMVAAGPPMAISVVGPETRRAVLLVLHPTAEPWMVSAPDWTPKGLCAR